MTVTYFAVRRWRWFAAALLAFCMASANLSASAPTAAHRPMRPGLQDSRETPQDATVNEYPIPTANSGSSNITVGPDGNFWFTETNGNKIGQVTTDGVFNEFPLPTVNSQPYGIALGPDFNVWFTEQGANKIGNIA